MNTYIGFHQGQYGDLFICLTAARVLKSLDPSCRLVYGINKKYKDVAEAFSLSEDIDEVVIWDGHDDWPTENDKLKLEELKLKYGGIKLFKPMPKHVIPDWYNYWHQTEEFCLMHGLPRPPKELQDFKLNHPKVEQGNYICISPYTSFGRSKNLTEVMIEEIKDFCDSNDLGLIQLGGPDDPCISGVEKFSGTYYESLIKMLGSKALVSADTGMVWAASAFSHPSLVFYSTKFYPNSSTSENWTPRNKNQISIESDYISNINVSVSEYLQKTIRERTYSKEQQDLFAKKIIGEYGFFLDIGCRTPVEENNTKLLELSGWSGMLFDIDQRFVDQCNEQRSNSSFCVDVTSNEFIKILKENGCPKVVDYISMDVDGASIQCLKNFLEAGFSFRCMTFEHTWDLKKPVKENCVNESRQLLESFGYEILFKDVVLAHSEHIGKPFEDWWINPELLNTTLESKEGMTHKDIINFIYP